MTIYNALPFLVFLVLALICMPRPPKRWNGETDPDLM